MKILPKIFKIIFTAIFVLQLASLAFLLFSPASTLAADPIDLKLQVDIPGEGGQPFKPDFSTKDTAAIAKYIQAIYRYAIGIVGILATVVMMVGGVMWITAGGASDRISEAKAWIGASLTGLILAISSYLILATVNPALVNFKISKIENVQSYGCCYAYADSIRSQVQCDDVKKQEECTNKTYSAKPCGQISYCSGKLGKDELMAATQDCLQRGGYCRDGCEAPREEPSGICAGQTPGISANKVCCIPKSIASNKKCADLNGGSCEGKMSTGGVCPATRPRPHPELDNTCPPPSMTGGELTMCCALE